MASNDPSYQSKEGYYPPQQTKGGYDYNAGALNADKGQEYEILEAGQRFNDGASAGLEEGSWASGADVEKQLRLGESDCSIRPEGNLRYISCYSVPKYKDHVWFLIQQ